jgi:plastocyanin
LFIAHFNPLLHSFFDLISSKMQFIKSAAFIVAAAGMASAADHLVLVGDNGLNFNPTTVTAAAGDNVIFEFRAKNHTVTQSSFAQPCTSLQTAAGPGVDSGYQPVPAGTTNFPQWSITIDNATAPLWFYCKQANHCQAGMVFAINPTAEKTFDAFQAAAKASGSGGAGGYSTSAPAGTAATTVPTASGFSTTKATSTGAPSTSSGTAAPKNNGASGMKIDGRAATLLAAVGLLAGLVL